MNITQMLYYDNPGETLAGYIQGKKASDIEERTARAQKLLGVTFSFRQGWSPLLGFVPYLVNDPGDLEVDFLSRWYGRYYPLMVQGEISHNFAAWQKIRDQEKIAKINEIFLPLNAHPAVLIPYTMLSTQEKANNLIRNGFLNGWTQQRFDVI